jgi:hypothetical protein
MDLERRKEIANTIIHQLGGGVFLRLTGAKNFCVLESGVSFKLPSRFAKEGINHIEIILNSSDTYDLKFERIINRKDNIIRKVLAEVSGVYCDQLIDIFESETALFVHF